MPKEDYEWDNNSEPLAYLITFRTYGTWLHGDKRRSVDTHDHKNVYGAIDRDPNPLLESRMKQNMPQTAVTLNREQREVVEETIKEVCAYRGYELHAVNVRSNHVHTVISGNEVPEKISEELKKYATRRLRECFLLSKETRLWSRGRSRQYLWKERQLNLAIEYVLYGQGDMPPEIK